MTGDSAFPFLAVQIEACRLAAIIRQVEMLSPGCFGEAATVIRKLAAGDDVAMDDLTAAIVSMRLTLHDVLAGLDRKVPPHPTQQ